jgi:hypothetical protein
MRKQGDTLTSAEQAAIDAGLARWYRGRLIPVMCGGADGDDDGDDGKRDDKGGKGDDDKGGDAARSFSADDVERIVRERLARAKATPPADYEELKAAKQKLDDLEKANQTDLEKAQTRTAELEKQASDATARAKEAILRSAIVAEAARKNVVDPDAAVALLDRSSLEFDDDGNPTNVATAMDALLKAKTYLVGGSRGNADQGAREGQKAGQLTSADLKNMSPEAIVAARRAGRLETVMRGDQ